MLTRFFVLLLLTFFALESIAQDLSVIATPHHVSGCQGDNTGWIEVSVGGGTGNYLYSLNGAPYQASNTFAGLVAGNYSINVKDDLTPTPRTGQHSVTINEPTKVTLTTENAYPASCNGTSDGSIVLNATGGETSIYYFSIDGGTNYQSGVTFSNLSPNTYTVRAKDANDCLSETSVLVVTEPDPIVINAHTSKDIKCYGLSTGEITITGTTGGSGSYYYKYNGTPFSNGATTTGLTAGSYTITVIDANAAGCSGTGFITTINEPDNLTVSATPTHIANCYGDATGVLDITPTGGVPNYNYYIKNNSNGQEYTQANNPQFSNLKAGSYTVTVTDANNCTTTINNQIISEPDPLALSTTGKTNVVGCYGASNGSISVKGSGGTLNYEFSVDGGITFQPTATNPYTFSNLAAGQYNTAIKDSKGCLTSGELIELTQPAAMTISSNNVENATCNGNADGKITVGTVSGGTSPYTYILDNGTTPVEQFDTDHIFTNLAPDTYDLSVRDNTGCLNFIENITITQPDPITLSSVDITHVANCFGDATGGFSLNITGGSGSAYKVSTDGGTTYPINPSTELTDLAAGTYSLYAQDPFGCTGNLGAHTINQPTELSPTTNSVADVGTCFGDATGSLTVGVPSGGIPPYSYQISGTQMQSSNVFENLSKGTYNVTVADSKGCIKSGGTENINEPDQLSITVIPTNIAGCYGDATGTITVNNTSGGTPTYQYSIDDGQNYQTSTVFSNLTAGTDYSIKVRDSKNCVQTLSEIAINQPQQLVITKITGTNIDCNGNNNGTISVTALGGTGTIRYSNNDGLNFYDNNGDFTNLTAGTYNITITDQNNCRIASKPYTITQPEQLVVVSTPHTDVTCFAFGDGSLSVNAAGGVKPYSYSKNNGATFQNESTFPNLQGGKYGIKIKDNKGCTVSTDSITIFEPSAIGVSNVTKTNVTGCYGDASGKITITASGGMAPLEYSINNGLSFQQENIFENLIGGKQYVLKIKDQNECVFYPGTYELTQPKQLKVNSVTSQQMTCNNANDASIVIEASGGTGALEYSIDNAATFETNNGSFQSLTEGLYDVVVRDANNCTASGSSITIINPTPIVIGAISNYNETCIDRHDGRIQVDASGGTGTLFYALSSDTYSVDYQMQHYFQSLSPNTYTVRIKDQKDCSIESDPIVIASPPNSAAIEADVRSGCSPLSVQLSQQDGSSDVYSWNFGDSQYATQTNPVHVFENYGLQRDTVYKVVAYARSVNGCNDTASVYIHVKPQPELIINASPKVQTYPNATISVQNNSEPLPNYSIDFGDGTTATFSAEVIEHTYSSCGQFTVALSATNSFGCSNTVTDTVLIKALQPLAAFESITEGCVPLSVDFTNTSQFAQTFLWDFDDGSTTNTQNPTYIFDRSGEYNVTLRALGDCDVYTDLQKTITVHPLPEPSFTVTPAVVYIPDQNTRFENNTLNGDQYFWRFGDGSTSDIASPVYTYTQEGIYDVTLIATSEKGCVDSLTVKNALRAEPESFIKFPSAFTPTNQDGVNDLFAPVYNGVETYLLRIFNSTGVQVFKTTDITQGWDGRASSNFMPQHVYFWIAEGKYINGKTFIESGNVTLIWK